MLHILLPAVQGKNVPESGDVFLSDQGAFEQFFHSLAQRNQIADQIPVIHGGNIQRPERFQSLGMIPVIIVAFPLFQTKHGLDGVLCSLHSFQSSDITKIPGSQYG